jgi:hypothetical protein
MLREIRSAVQNHLGLQADDLTSQPKTLDCNCAFARQILERDILDMPHHSGIPDSNEIVLSSANFEIMQRNEGRLEATGPPTRFLVIHGKSVVEWLEAESPTNFAIQDCLRRKFGQSFINVRQVILMSGERG